MPRISHVRCVERSGRRLIRCSQECLGRTRCDCLRSACFFQQESETAFVAVLLVLFGSTLLFRVLGFTGVTTFSTWLVSARVALAIMFLFTAASHFGPMKGEPIAMVPPD